MSIFSLSLLISFVSRRSSQIPSCRVGFVEAFPKTGKLFVLFPIQILRMVPPLDGVPPQQFTISQKVRTFLKAHRLPVGLHIGQQKNAGGVDAHNVDRVIYIAVSIVASSLITLFALVICCIVGVRVYIIG